MRTLSLLSPVLLLACSDGAFTRHNGEPLAEILSPEGGSAVREASRLVLRGAVSDPDVTPDQLTARWFLDGAETCGAAAPATDGTTECTITVPSADFAVELEGHDPEGAGASALVELQVIDDLAPDATITTPTAEGRYYSDRPMLLTGTVNDPEDPPTSLAVRWVSSLEGELPNAATVTEDGAVQGYANLSQGMHALQLFAVDVAGNEAVDDVVVTVRPPDTAPTCAISAPADGAVVPVGELVSLRGTVDDAELGPELLAVTWASSRDGVLGTAPASASGAVGLDTTSLSVGAHELSLTAADEIGLECTVSVGVVIDTPPSAILDAPVAGSVANGGDDVAFLGRVSDAEDAPDTLIVAWTSDRDGLLAEGTADSAGRSVFTLADLSVGEHTITETVTDSAGLTASASTTLRINGAPDAPTVSIDPVDPRTADDLVAVIDLPATDPDGDPLTYQYAWSVDGAASGASTTDSLPASATARGETWRVDVTASDGWITGPAGSASVTILNTAPGLASVAVTPNPATRSSTLTCTAAGYADADGDADATTYAWTVNGSAVAAGSTLSGAFTTGDLVTCAATPYDGNDVGLTLYGSVTIQNSPPIVDSLALTPTPAYTDDTLSAGVVVHDPEADAINLAYAWTVDGVAVAPITSTLDGSYFSKHQVVTVTVTPSDADGPGVAVSASVTITNSPPEAPTVGFDPTDPEEGDSVVCEVTGAAADADGDPITYAMDWTVDGFVYPGAGDVGPSTTVWADDTVAAADTDAYELYTCTVTPDDGDDLGPSASASVEIDNAETRVFVTSNDYNAAFGSLSVADAKCQTSADAAGLGGTWVAFLSSSGASAASRIPDGPYVLLDGTTIATSRADLLDGSLASPIQVDENGSRQSKWVFTGSTTAGLSAASGSSVNGLCADWTNGCGVCYGNHYYATVGRSYESSSNWTNVGWIFCSQSSGLYCFEQ